MSRAGEGKCGGMKIKSRLGLVKSGETWETAGAAPSFTLYVGWWTAKIVGEAPMGRTTRRLVRRVKEDVKRVLCWVLC